jgi:hypothetical protein
MYEDRTDRTDFLGDRYIRFRFNALHSFPNLACVIMGLTESEDVNKVYYIDEIH